MNGLLSNSDHQRKSAAWNNAASAVGYDQNVYRIDCDKRYIAWAEYGMHSEYGWEIDHIHPTALGGLDVFSNIRARHWRGNSAAGGVLGGLLGDLGGLGRR